MRKTLGALIGAVMALAMVAVPAQADPPPRGMPQDMADAYRAMGCKFGEVFVDDGSGDEPPNKSVDCYTRKFGTFSIARYRSTQDGRDWWLGYWLTEGSWAALKGHLVVTYQDDRGGYTSYDKWPTRWAARKIGGWIAQGRG